MTNDAVAQCRIDSAKADVTDKMTDQAKDMRAKYYRCDGALKEQRASTKKNEVESLDWRDKFKDSERKFNDYKKAEADSFGPVFYVVLGLAVGVASGLGISKLFGD